MCVSITSIFLPNKTSATGLLLQSSANKCSVKIDTECEERRCGIDLTHYHTMTHFSALKIHSCRKHWEKGEIACYKQFLLFPQCFLPFTVLIFHFKCNLKCGLQFVSISTSLKFCRLVTIDKISFCERLMALVTNRAIPYLHLTSSVSRGTPF